MRILVVADEQRLAAAIRRGLEEHGVDRRTVGEQAHQVELAAGERDTEVAPDPGLHHEAGPGVVIQDLHAPPDTCQEVRGLSRSAAHPSSSATCSNQRTKGGGSHTPPTSTRAKWAKRGT